MFKSFLLIFIIGNKLCLVCEMILIILFKFILGCIFLKLVLIILLIFIRVNMVLFLWCVINLFFLVKCIE